jgi:subtilisin family serine protease
MRALLRSAVLFGLVTLVWAPATVAVEPPQRGIGVADTPASQPPAIAAQPTRHIVGVRDVPAAQRAASAANLHVSAVIPIIDAIVVEGPEAAVNALKSNPWVRYVEPDPLDAVWTQADTLVYGVYNIEAEVVWGGFAGATSVMPGHGGAGVNVAVIDTGIDCGHPDLQTNCIYGASFVKGAKPFDDFGHGTHVAGIIAARNNGFGVIGVAPEATLYAVKVLDRNGSGSWSAVASGVVWAIQHGMHVINMSLGGSAYSQALADAVKAASDAGILVVSAAGNSGCCNTVLYPAKLPESMAIAAVDVNDQRPSFSSTGIEVDVAAPGVAILSTVPTRSCTLCDPSGYRTLSGTSMATPHVTGTAALLISRGFTAATTWEQMAGTAKDLGYSGFDLWTGWGRVNALAATTQQPSFPPIADTAPPTVAFLWPADGFVISSNTVTVKVAAADETQLSRVELRLSWTVQSGTTFYKYTKTLASSTSSSPLTYKWQTDSLSSNTYTLEARAFDGIGHLTTTHIIVVKP